VRETCHTCHFSPSTPASSSPTPAACFAPDWRTYSKGCQLDQHAVIQETHGSATAPAVLHMRPANTTGTHCHNGYSGATRTPRTPCHFRSVYLCMIKPKKYSPSCSIQGLEPIFSTAEASGTTPTRRLVACFLTRAARIPEHIQLRKDDLRLSECVCLTRQTCLEGLLHIQATKSFTYDVR
jgi:hypothetical protein